MSKTIWVSRDQGHESDLIWSAEPRNMNGYFGLLVGDSYIAEGAHNDFFGVQPGECRRFLVIPDDDWISVSSGRFPEVGQVIWVTAALHGKDCVISEIYCGVFDWKVTAWKPVYKPEPYKPEGGGRDEQE